MRVISTNASIAQSVRVSLEKWRCYYRVGIDPAIYCIYWTPTLFVREQTHSNTCALRYGLHRNRNALERIPRRLLPLLLDPARLDHLTAALQDQLPIYDWLPCWTIKIINHHELNESSDKLIELWWFKAASTPSISGGIATATLSLCVDRLVAWTPDIDSVWKSTVRLCRFRTTKIALFSKRSFETIMQIKYLYSTFYSQKLLQILIPYYYHFSLYYL